MQTRLPDEAPGRACVGWVREWGEMMDATKVGIFVRCSICGHDKAPHGRSVSMHRHYCEARSFDGTHGCVGYASAPLAGCLFPGETDAEFGYPCCDAGTEPLLPRNADQMPNKGEIAPATSDGQKKGR